MIFVSENTAFNILNGTTVIFICNIYNQNENGKHEYFCDK